MSFPAYDSYKSTGHDWLGTIPTSWRTQKFRHLFKESSEKIEGEVFGEMLSVSGYRGIERKEYDDENRRRSDEDLIGYRIVRKGQLVVNTMWLNYAGLGFSELDGHVSPAYRAYWPKSDEHSKYLHYLLRSEHYVKGYTRLLTGVRPNSLQMSRDNMMSFPVVLPPKAEQIAISTFLDRETAKIDALIAEQQRLIELLQEKRQAVISHAVTKGLNPNAPMKDSGVEWLGDVPEHWTICPLKHFCKITTGFAFKSEEFQAEGIPLVRISDIQSDGTIDLKDAKYLKESELIDHSRETLKHGDIAMAMTGGTIGKAGIYYSDQPALLNQRVCIFRAKPDCSQAFLWFITASRFYQEHIKLSSFGGAQPNISDGDLLACICPMPPLAEQELISAFIDSKAAKLGELQREAELTIELLNERRSALISAAVTGQIDVRGLVEEEGSEQ